MKLLLSSTFFLVFPLLAFAETLPEEFKGKPEDFDWNQYVTEGNSTADEMDRAKKGVILLTQRMDQIFADYRRLLESRKDTEELRRMTEMQATWQKAADAEVAFIGGAWDGGSGAKAAYPRARMECYLRHVKDLIEMKARCMALNE